MIFASDLDQTLIYSRKHAECLHEDEKVIVEYKDGTPLSYMSQSAKQLLKEISEQITFVPVTTRIEEQYTRINLGIYQGRPPYAIISNGGRILIDGKDDREWHSHIQQQLTHKCRPLMDVLAYLKTHHCGPWVQSIRVAEELFIYLIVQPENIPMQDMHIFKKWLNDSNWELSIQGRKIYCIPNVVQKNNALEHLSKKLEKQLFAGAGDSFLDLSFLKKVQYPIVPRHGELFDQYKEILSSYAIQITAEKGIKASDELLLYLLKHMNVDVTSSTLASSC